MRTLWKVAVGVTVILAIPTWGRAEAPASDECLQRIEISSGWKIKSFAPQSELDATLLDEAARADEGWLDAGRMPATVHDILLRLGKIDAPWLPHSTEKCFWVGQQDWVYAVRFSVEAEGREARLRFMGIENKVDVYLNGKRLASHASKLSLLVDVSGRLRSENVLVLHCHADLPPGQGQRSDRGSYLGPNPAISSVGIFDKVLLEISDGHRFEEVVADAALDETLTRGTVTVDVAGVSWLDAVTLRVRLLDPDVACAGDNSVPVSIDKGNFNGRCAVQIERPSLWWPRGYGDQPLYRVEIALVSQGRVQEVAYRTVGFRRVTMPELLHFVVNGVPVFLRGGDWVTPDLMSDVWDTARVDRLFATLTDNSGRVLARTNAFADIERRLTFPEATLDVQLRQGTLVLTTDKFARCVTLSGDSNGDAFGWFFEDNYFDLMPGEKKVVRILGDHETGRITAKAWYSPHATTVDWQRVAAKKK